MDQWFVAGLLVVVTVLLLTERIRADIVAMMSLAALILFGILEPGQALSGFSNEATVTVACMFVISAGLKASGVVEYMGDRLLLHGPSTKVALLLLTAAVIAPLSAFINNTAVVAVFLPIILRACQGNRVSSSQLMMPLSFFAMIGGTCTLMGTSTNILVSQYAATHGLREFRMFEFSKLGLIMLVVGTAYLLLIARHQIPERLPAESPTHGFVLNRYLSEVVVLEGSPLIGLSLVEARLGERYELEVFGHSRDKVMRTVPDVYPSLEEGDLLMVKAPADALLRLGNTAGLAVKPGRHPDVADLRAADSVLVEAVITPNSDLDGRTLKGVDFRNRYGATTLAIRRGEDVREKIGRLRLRVGDELLILAPRRNLPRLKEQTSFVVLQELDVPVLKPVRATLACLITAGIVAAVTIGNFSIAGAAVIGAVAMVLSGCLPARRVYQNIDWQVIFLLAGLIPLGLALETTQAANTAVELLLHATGGWGPTAVLGLFFLVASVLTGFMSNNATAVLLAPLALTCAEAMGVDPRPFLVALSFAASAAFWTPIGYQTNLLVYGPGGYRYSDFMRVGGPLTLIYWLLCTLLIPVLFPFQPEESSMRLGHLERVEGRGELILAQVGPIDGDLPYGLAGLGGLMGDGGRQVVADQRHQAGHDRQSLFDQFGPAIGGDAALDTSLGEVGRGGPENLDRRHQVVGRQRKHGVQLEEAPFRRLDDRLIVADDLCRNLDRRLGDDRIDLTRHDRATRLDLRDL